MDVSAQAKVKITRPDAALFPPRPAAADSSVLSLKRDEGMKLAQRRSKAHTLIASLIEADAERMIKRAKQNVEKRLRYETDTRHFTEAWEALLKSGTPEQICTLMRDASEQTEQLRINHPFLEL